VARGPRREGEDPLAVRAREVQEDRMTRPILALLALLAGGCAAHRSSSSQNASSSPGTQPAGNGKGAAPALLCRTERPTGSNIMTRVCYSEDELDTMSQAAQDLHRRALQTGSVQKERN
jgi:hypothetical protein